MKTKIAVGVLASALSFWIGELLASPVKVPQEFYKGSPSIISHPGHYPFISHITFSKTCDFVIEQGTEWFDPEWIKQGDIIYLNIWYLPWFRDHIHPKIKYPYILVTADVGAWLPGRSMDKLLYDPKLAAWFGRNMLFSYHPKLHQIPMGQDISLFWFDADELIYLANAHTKLPQIKQHLLYMNHYPRTFGDRDKIVKLFENEPYCFTRNRSDREYSGVSREAYYDDMLLSKFVISPLGLETDCVRTWEAVALDCIPIVEHTFLDPLYEDLPILLINNWGEVTQSFLEEKYQQLKDKKKDTAYFDHWHRRIKEEQDKIRRDDLSAAKLEATLFNEKDLLDLAYIVKKKSNTHKSALIYRGFLTTLRPLQLANTFNFLTRIFVDDPWFTEKTVKTFENFVSDRSLLKDEEKIVICSSKNIPNHILKSGFLPVFLDLSYHRNSLNLNSRDFRHTLLQDITDIYKELKPGALLCGNMRKDTFVNEVIKKFVHENGLVLEKKGNFWFFNKI